MSKKQNVADDDGATINSEVPQTYRKKPIVVMAVRLSSLNIETINAWINTHSQDRVSAIDKPQCCLEISTLEGVMIAHLGDWVIQGVAGEFYPCKNEIFHNSYEAAG